MQGIAAGLFSLQPKVFWRKRGFLPFEFESGYLPAFLMPDWLSVPLAWPHTCDIRKVVMFIAWTGSSSTEGPDSLSRAQETSGCLGTQSTNLCWAYWQNLQKPNIFWKTGLFNFFSLLKYGWNFFWISCVSYGVEQGCESHGCSGSLHLGLDSAVGQFLSCQLWPLPCTHPRKVLGVHPPSPMHTHPHGAILSSDIWLCPLSLWKERGPGWRRSWGQQMWLMAVQTQLHCLGTASLQCTRRRHEMQSLIPWALCPIYMAINI